MNLFIYLIINREGTQEKERVTAPERMTRERRKRAFQRPMGNPEETISEEPKEKKSRKNGSAKSKATDRDVDQSIRKALR